VLGACAPALGSHFGLISTQRIHVHAFHEAQLVERERGGHPRLRSACYFTRALGVTVEVVAWYEVVVVQAGLL